MAKKVSGSFPVPLCAYIPQIVLNLLGPLRATLPSADFPFEEREGGQSIEDNVEKQHLNAVTVVVISEVHPVEDWLKLAGATAAKAKLQQQ